MEYIKIYQLELQNNLNLTNDIHWNYLQIPDSLTKSLKSFEQILSWESLCYYYFYPMIIIPSDI